MKRLIPVTIIALSVLSTPVFAQNPGEDHHGRQGHHDRHERRDHHEHQKHREHRRHDEHHG